MPKYTVRDGRIVAPKLEFNAVEHCNYHCAECSHFSPYLRRASMPIDAFQRDVTALATAYHVQQLKFVGGEPLLNREITTLIEIAKASGIANEIALGSNGSLIHKAEDALFEALDVLVISWYPDARCDEDKIRFAQRKCREFGTRLTVQKIDQFRRMQWTGPPADSDLTEAVFSTCQIAHVWSCQTFYHGHFYLCSRPLFTRPYLQIAGEQAPELEAVDGCSLHEPLLFERLQEYLGTSTPLRSCAYCLGTIGKTIPWRSLTKEEKKRGQPHDDHPGSLIDDRRRRKLKALLPTQRILYRLLPTPLTSKVLSKVTDAIIGY